MLIPPNSRFRQIFPHAFRGEDDTATLNRDLEDIWAQLDNSGGVKQVHAGTNVSVTGTLADPIVNSLATFTFIARVQATGASPTITVSGLPATYKHFRVYFAMGSSSTNVVESLNLTLNNDASNFYDWVLTKADPSAGATPAVTTANHDTIFRNLAAIPGFGGSSITTQKGSGFIDIMFSDRGSNFFTEVVSQSMTEYNNFNLASSVYGGVYRGNTGTITRVDLTASSGANLFTNSFVDVYGIA